jgi:hypothetical protein
MAGCCKPFTHAKVKYFDRSEVNAAGKWLQGSEEAARNRRRADRPTQIFEKSEIWDGYPWFGL